ncbi:MAG TPA: hypothetical protein VHL98_07425 [Microvirga sp.]|jgi:hypothetical protein|nr:hypothetical protein [Microvirga sp.]
MPPAPAKDSLPNGACVVAAAALAIGLAPTDARAGQGQAYAWHHETAYKLVFFGIPESDGVAVSLTCDRPGAVSLALFVDRSRTAPARSRLRLRVVGPGPGFEDFTLPVKRTPGDDDSGTDTLAAVIPLNGRFMARLMADGAERFGAVAGPGGPWLPLWGRERWITLDGAQAPLRRLRTWCR